MPSSLGPERRANGEGASPSLVGEIIDRAWRRAAAKRLGIWADRDADEADWDDLPDPADAARPPGA